MSPDRCGESPGCEHDAGHVAAHPCGRRHIPGSPCRYCGAPTPLNDSACQACWISLEGLPLADIKGLLALGDLSVTIADLQ